MICFFVRYGPYDMGKKVYLIHRNMPARCDPEYTPFITPYVPLER